MAVMRPPLDAEIRRAARASSHEHGDDAGHLLYADRKPGFVDKPFPRYILAMNLQAAADLAKQHIADLFAAESPHDIRLETFLYDDHLMVWSLTIGFTRADDRISKLVRVSEANHAVLSIKDP